jgi:hypothetical protein
LEGDGPAGDEPRVADLCGVDVADFCGVDVTDEPLGLRCVPIERNIVGRARQELKGCGCYLQYFIIGCV